MLPLYILALIVHAAYTTTPCQDGTEIVSKETKNPQDLIGNWTYVYHWDSMKKFNQKYIKYQKFTDNKGDIVMRCPGISIEAVTPQYVKAKKAECRDSYTPFNWTDAKLKLDAPLMNTKGVMLVMGEKGNWMMMECKNIVRVVLKKVSEEYIVIIPEIAHVAEMIARRTPTMEELKCVAHNVDVGKGMSGYGLCV